MNTAVRGLSSVAPQRQMTTTSAAGRPMWSARTLEHQRLQVVAQALNRQAKEETVSKFPLLEESTVVWASATKD
eukprot:jgi/Picre1/27344/NNA_000313.t1